MPSSSILSLIGPCHLVPRPAPPTACPPGLLLQSRRRHHDVTTLVANPRAAWGTGPIYASIAREEGPLLRLRSLCRRLAARVARCEPRESIRLQVPAAAALVDHVVALRHQGFQRRRHGATSAPAARTARRRRQRGPRRGGPAGAQGQMEQLRPDGPGARGKGGARAGALA